MPAHPAASTTARRTRRCSRLFARQDFIYDAEHDHYACPTGAKLTKIHRRVDHTEDFDRYRHRNACLTCPLRPRCTPTRRRIIKRWENEDVLDRMHDGLDRMPEAMGVRRQIVEHRFGTLKAWMGATHFLTRTLDKVRTEVSLHVLAYNLKSNDQDLRGGTAGGGDPNLIASLKPRAPVGLSASRPSARETQRVGRFI